MVFVEKVIVPYYKKGKMFVPVNEFSLNNYKKIEVILSNGADFVWRSINDVPEFSMDLGAIGFSYNGVNRCLVTYNKAEQLLYEMIFNGYAQMKFQAGKLDNGVIYDNLERYNIFQAYKIGLVRFEDVSPEFNLMLTKYLMMG